jgi:hypothetical protein
MKHKIIIVGDIHLGKFGSDISLFINFVKKVLLPQCDKETVIIFTGDQFETSYADIVLLNEVLDIFDEIHSRIHSACFLIGNHCTYKHEEISINMTNLFRTYKNFHVFENDTVSINDKSFHFLSFHKDMDFVRKAIADSTADYLISHEEINSFLFNKFRPINGGIGIDELSKFKLVFNGHIHRKQTVKNVYTVGSPYQMNYNDSGNICGLHILDTDTNEVEFIENTHYPKYHKLEYDDIIKEEFDKTKYVGDNVWVINSKDDNNATSILQDIKSLRINTMIVENESDDSVEFQHKDDVTDHISEYLSSITEIPISGKVLELNKELIEELVHISNKL